MLFAIFEGIKNHDYYGTTIYVHSIRGLLCIIQKPWSKRQKQPRTNLQAATGHKVILKGNFS